MGLGLLEMTIISMIVIKLNFNSLHTYLGRYSPIGNKLLGSQVVYFQKFAYI